MIKINKEMFEGVISLAKNEEEKQKLITFIEDENNNDFLEYSILYTKGRYGWATLSSGKMVYVSPPMVSAEEAGKALKSMLKRLNS